MSWVLLWSYEQSALHIEPMERMFELNRIACLKNRGGDYRPLMLGAREEVEAYADKVRAVIEARGHASRVAA